MDEYEKFLEKHITTCDHIDIGTGRRAMLDMALSEYRAFKAKSVEATAEASLDIQVEQFKNSIVDLFNKCLAYGVEDCEKDIESKIRFHLSRYRPAPFKAKADGGLVERLAELQKEIYALKLKERDGLANPETELNDRYRLGISAGLGIASDKMSEILRAHEGGEK